VKEKIFSFVFFVLTVLLMVRKWPKLFPVPFPVPAVAFQYRVPALFGCCELLLARKREEYLDFLMHYSSVQYSKKRLADFLAFPIKI
jgi:hypothetical protein